MSDANNFWDREKLYDEVWQEPVSKVAKRYGISDVGLAKACRSLSIPLPGRGYWAKKAHGHAVKQTPLKPISNLIRVPKPIIRPTIQQPPKPEFPQNEEDKAEFARIEQLQSNGALKPISTEKALKHPSIIRARKALSKSRGDARHILCAGYPDECLDIRVTQQSLERALVIMASLISIFEHVGLKVGFDREAKSQTYVAYLDEKVHFSIREKVKQFERAGPIPTNYYGPTFRGKPIDYAPTGILELETPDGSEGLKNTWRDSERSPLEDLIPEAAAGILRVGVALRRRTAYWREREDVQRRRQEELMRLAEEFKAEDKRLSQLLVMVENWRRAKDIRSFLSEIVDAKATRAADSTPDAEFLKWIVWAKAQADRLDPLTPSPRSVLDRKNELKSLPAWMFSDPSTGP